MRQLSEINENLVSELVERKIVTDTFRRLSATKKNRIYNCVKYASKILDLAKSNPPKIHVLIPPIVPSEWAKHFENVMNDVTQIINRLETLREIGKFFSITTEPVEKDLYRIAECLSALSKGLLEAGIWLDEDNDIKVRAYNRAIEYLPPARRGAVQDCGIYEHSLEVFTQLREQSNDRKCVFLTSNTEDYCGGTKTIPRECINSELKKLSVSFTTTWDWAFGELNA